MCGRPMSRNCREVDRSTRITVTPAVETVKRFSEHPDVPHWDAGRDTEQRRPLIDRQKSTIKSRDLQDWNQPRRQFQHQHRSRRDQYFEQISDTETELDEFVSKQRCRRNGMISCSRSNSDAESLISHQSSDRDILRHRKTRRGNDRSNSKGNRKPRKSQRRFPRIEPTEVMKKSESNFSDDESDTDVEADEFNPVKYHERDSAKERYQDHVCRRRRRHSSNYDNPDVQTVCRRKSGGYMKPEKFNGTTCFETFLVQFDNCAKFNGWHAKDKLQYLRWSLTGTAAQMLWGTEGMSFQQLVARLRSRFGSLDMEEKYQTEVQCRRRKTDETLRKLAQDIRRLMMLAYPGDRSQMSERLAKEYFICALDDPELELKVREKEPQSLDSALKAAQRLGVFRNAIKQRTVMRHRFSRQVTEASELTSESFDERLAKIEQGLREPRERSKTLSKQTNSSLGSISMIQRRTIKLIINRQCVLLQLTTTIHGKIK